MRPDWLPENAYADLEQRALVVLAQADLPSLPPLVALCASAEWLFDELVRRGHTREEAALVCRYHGQASFPDRDPWTVALVMLERTETGNLPASPETFTDALLTGAVTDLPPGGLRIACTTDHAKLN
jgi:hypothetical protein